MRQRFNQTNIDVGLSWREFLKRSKLDLSPAKYESGDLPVRPAPGRTVLV